VTIDQQARTQHPNTRELYKALYESYTENRMFYDLVMLGYRAALLLPLLVRTNDCVWWYGYMYVCVCVCICICKWL
jgi:hypothetical protein